MANRATKARSSFPALAFIRGTAIPVMASPAFVRLGNRWVSIPGYLKEQSGKYVIYAYIILAWYALGQGSTGNIFLKIIYRQDNT